MRNEADQSDQAFQHLVRVLEDAVRAKADSVGLEWEGRELMVVHYFGAMGIGATRIPPGMGQEVIEEIVKRAKLTRKPTGKMLVTLLGEECELPVEEYDSFGESAFVFNLKTDAKKNRPAR